MHNLLHLQASVKGGTGNRNKKLFTEKTSMMTRRQPSELECFQSLGA